MKTNIFLILVILAGWNAFTACQSRRYVYVNILQSWTEAQSYCQEKHTDLATIDNMDEMNQLINTVKSGNGHSASVWIGLYDIVNNWEWSFVDEQYYGEGEADFRHWRNWNNGEPNNYGGQEFCVTIGSGGYFWDNPCNTKVPFICYKGATPESPNMFVKENTTMNWSEAQSFCRENYIDLASVRNLGETEEIRKFLQTGTSAWIGLYRKPWRWWSDFSVSTFKYWDENQPDNRHGPETCVASMLPSGKWHDYQCQDKHHFVCYDKVVEKQVIRLKVAQRDSSTDLNDKAVMEAILQEIQNRLEDEGVKANLKWRTWPDGKVFRKEEDFKSTK